MVKKLKVREMGPILFLSLFLLLLAFFILLNSISSFEEVKAREVIKSVVSTFRTPTETNTRVQIFVASYEDIERPEQAIDYLEQLWVTSMPVVEVDVLQEGTLMEMRFSISELYEQNALEIRADRRFLLDSTANALNQNIPGAEIFFQVLFPVENYTDIVKTAPDNIETNPLNAQDIGLVPAAASRPELSFLRINNFVQSFVEERNVDITRIKAGLKPTAEDEIVARFYIFPKSDFASTVPENEAGEQ